VLVPEVVATELEESVVLVPELDELLVVLVAVVLDVSVVELDPVVVVESLEVLVELLDVVGAVYCPFPEVGTV
jgi:hypothetical protein